jgi:uncharacterized protein (DUF488 family)
VEDARLQEKAALLSIGHSNHEIEKLLGLLKLHAVDVVVDVRSQPVSRFSPHFDRAPLEKSLRAEGMKYVFLGAELGGRPRGPEFYDDEGHVLYGRLARSALFLEGIERLKKGMQNHTIAVLCSEEDPVGCHRRLLIGRVLAEQGVNLQHIRGDGRVQDEGEFDPSPAARQTELFAEPEEKTWRSIRSVLHRGAPQTSSEH